MFSVILSLTLTLALGQTAGAPPIPADTLLNAGANLAFEAVGPGDLIYLSVPGSAEMTKSFRVSAQGTLSIPLLADPVQVTGLMPAEIEKTIARRLVDDHILVSPIVSVMVLEYRSRPVNIAGAVKHPITLQALGELKLLDAIARADGLTSTAGPEILVSYAGAHDSQVKHVPVKELFSGADPGLNFQLRGGEEIRIPEAEKFYIVGNVKSPGTYPLDDIQGSSVLKALALSQGLLPFARKEAYVYRPVSGTRDRQEIQVPLGRILQRKSPDFPLLANDIFYIPDNSAKRLSANVLEKISGVAGATVSGMIIWH
jgi:polysaccharide export outer membrane protein